MAEVDLDRLARAYAHRHEAGVERRVIPALEAAGVGSGDQVIDVGGGRGRHAAAMRSLAGCRSIVVDPSRAMLAEARAAGVEVVRGRGERLPFADASAALAFFHLSIHHGDWAAMVSEARRVVRPDGVVWVWTMSPEYHRSSHLARWFPRVGEIDAARFPEPEDLRIALAAGKARTGLITAVEHVVRPAADWVGAVRAGYVSTLHLLSRDEIEEGLAAFVAANPDPTAEIGYDLEIIGVWGSTAR